MKRARLVGGIADGDEQRRKTRAALVQHAAAAAHVMSTGTRGPGGEGEGEGAVFPACPEAARFWSERAWSELAAVPAMAQIQLALLRDEVVDTDVLGAFATIGADEVRHTELSRAIADRLGGYVDVIPDSAVWEPARLGDPSTMPLPFWLVASGCISETVSLALMNARLPHTTHPGVHAILSAIIKDEAVHQRVGWDLAERVLPDLDAAFKKELGEYAAAMLDVIGVSFATAGLHGRARDEARALREVTAARGLGAAPPDEEDRACADVINDVIAPRLARHGVAVPQR